MAKLYPLAFAGWRTALLLLLLILLSVPSPTSAEGNPHMIPLSLTERVQQSDLVVEGEVVSQESFWDAQHENIYTSNIIKVYKSFKGEVRQGQLEVITEGGTVGLQKHVVSTALRLRPGQQGIFFLTNQKMLQRTPASISVSTMPYGSQQGFVRYNIDSRTASSVFDRYSTIQQLYERVANETGKSYRSVTENTRLSEAPAEENRQQAQSAPLAPVIVGFSPTVASAGTGTILTINGTGFGSSRGSNYVEFANADDGGQSFVRPLPRDYVSWSNTQIRVYVPSITIDEGTAGSGVVRVTVGGSTFTSVSELIIPYAYSNVSANNRSFRPILTNRNGRGGYTIRFAPSMQTRQAAREGFRRAMNTWVCVSQVNWQIGGSTTIDKAAADGTVVVRFAPPSTVGAGVLARTISQYSGCRSATDTLYWVTEFDMEINSSINWQYGPAPPVNRQFDFETVMLHELGHAHQLSHVNIDQAVMLYAIEFEKLYRDLSEFDVVGANLVMANSTEPNFCEQPPMIPNLNGECNLAPEVYTLEADFINENAVQLTLVTRNERGVNNFVVQRSEDGIEWEDVATIEANGPRNGDLTYAFTDTAPLPDVSYYRVQVMYSTGDPSFSPRVRVLNPSSLRQLRLYPNPFTDAQESQLQLFYVVQTTTDMQIQLYSTTGKLVRDFTLQVTDENLPITLDLSGIAAGMYILKWQEGTRSGQERIVKL